MSLLALSLALLTLSLLSLCAFVRVEFISKLINSSNYIISRRNYF